MYNTSEMAKARLAEVRSRNGWYDVMGKRQHYVNGYLHSVNDEPAVIKEQRDYVFKKWYKDGKIHRTTGPAVTSTYGEHYYLFGKEYTKEEWEIRKQYDGGKIPSVELTEELFRSSTVAELEAMGYTIQVKKGNTKKYTSKS